MSNEQAPTQVESKVTPAAAPVPPVEDTKSKKNGGNKNQAKPEAQVPQKSRQEIVVGELHALDRHFGNLHESRVEHLDRQFVHECLSRIKRGITMGVSEWDRSNALAVKYLKNK